MAGGLVEGPDGVLLVQNRRRNGTTDWSPPGGVIEVQAGESLTDGLTREVLEETGLTVTGWEGPLYRVEAVAADAGWHLQAEVHRATGWQGELNPGDPDEIVIDARFVPLQVCAEHLASNHRWVREPLTAWLLERWAHVDPRGYRYTVSGPGAGAYTVVLETG